MQVFKILIADDERLAREAIKLALPSSVAYNIVAECSDGTDTIAKIKEHLPDIVFLDIQMPECTGLEVLRSLPAKYQPYLIIVSAYDNYALEAYEYDASDYLLKPFTQDRFDKAFQKAIKSRDAAVLSEQLIAIRSLSDKVKHIAKPATVYKSRISIKDGAKIIVVPCDEIVFFEAKNDYLSVQTTEKKYLYNEALSTLEELLDPSIFARIHRSSIVNIKFIKELSSHYNGDYTIVLKNGASLKLSRNYREKLLQIIG